MRKRKKKYLIPLLPPSMYGQPFQSVPADPQGSYTGVPEDPKEVPVQDVDDL